MKGVARKSTVLRSVARKTTLMGVATSTNTIIRGVAKKPTQ